MASVPVVIRIDGREAASVTRLTPIGAHVVVLSTALVDPQAPVSVTSTYVAERRTGTHATHLTLRPGHDPELQTRMHKPGDAPVDADQRRSGLYDHLQAVLAALQSLGHVTTIDVLDDTAQLLDS